MPRSSSSSSMAAAAGSRSSRAPLYVAIGFALAAVLSVGAYFAFHGRPMAGDEDVVKSGVKEQLFRCPDPLLSTPRIPVERCPPPSEPLACPECPEPQTPQCPTCAACPACPACPPAHPRAVGDGVRRSGKLPCASDCGGARRGTCFVGVCACRPGFDGEACEVEIDHPGQCSDISDRCFAHPRWGINQVSHARWQRAQEAESSLWAGYFGDADRNDEHREHFGDYQAVRDALPTHRLGRMMELGCGPYTQTKTLLNALGKENWGSIDEVTLADPSLMFYTKNVR